MLDIKIIRENPEQVKDNIKKRNLILDVDAFLEIDKNKNYLIVKTDELRALKNKVSKQIPTLSNEEKPAKIAEMKKVGEELKSLEIKQKEVDIKWKNMYYKFPNVLDPTAAIGKDDEENKAVSKFLEPTKFDFEPKTHYEIGEKKDWIDIEKGSEVSGARFWYLKGDLVFLQFALVNYALSQLGAEGFTPVLPPLMTKQKAMFGTGFFPADEDGLYQVNPEIDELYMIGTAEVPVTSYHCDEVIDVEKPKKYVGYSTCFRREAGSAGKDTRGILRGHQFDKIEMVTFCKPEESKKMHNEMVAIEEKVWQSLGIPYQKLNVCSGDLGNPAIKKYDLEAWMPGEERYREVTSCSNVGEYQSRRLNIKYKDSDGNRQFVHTLNGTVIALSRCLIAIIENYQTADGNVKIPKVLIPFMGGRTEI
ncbi:MAG: serine--tRNA ligase [Candidatus Gracilibacteria bacterium]|nr:serine--tRNA ligase [Candidatus Gracilibacteria bacterium]MDQ7022530.1 serine--tRNA ligase [Candidatus Gracilibacteria bacterium]